MRRERILRFFFSGMLLFLFVFLSSCVTRGEVPVGAVLSQMLLYEKDCPAGVIYRSSAEEGEEGYLSESLCSALYGDGAMPAEWASVEDFAIFQSATPSPAELAVFLAVSSADAEEIAEMCARRLAVLRNYYKGTDSEVYTSGGKVVILGRYVLMLVSSDAETALSEARDIIG